MPRLLLIQLIAWQKWRNTAFGKTGKWLLNCRSSSSSWMRNIGGNCAQERHGAIHSSNGICISVSFKTARINSSKVGQACSKVPSELKCFLEISDYLLDFIWKGQHDLIICSDALAMNWSPTIKHTFHQTPNVSNGDFTQRLQVTAQWFVDESHYGFLKFDRTAQ